MYIQKIMNTKNYKIQKKHFKALRKVAAVLLIFTLCLSAYAVPLTEPSYAASRVRIAHARTGERSGRGNKAGDQTGREVTVTKWYYRSFNFQAAHWQYVMRFKDPEMGRRLAAKMVDACNNDHIGYDLNDKDRATLYDQARKHNWDIAAIDKDCETTCSGVISVCLNAIGVRMPKYWSTNDMLSDLSRTGLFFCYTDAEYTQTSSKLVVGDILIHPGSHKHTAVVVESPHPFTYPVTYKNAEGKEKTTYVAEKTEMILNNNNGEDLTFIIVDQNIDLTGLKPKKAGFKFAGWRKTSKSTFSAIYNSKMAVIKTPSQAITISKDKK